MYRLYQLSVVIVTLPLVHEGTYYSRLVSGDFAVQISQDFLAGFGEDGDKREFRGKVRRG